jgi:uncharacterized membrane protein YbhN (UPF0104 family)
MVSGPSTAEAAPHARRATVRRLGGLAVSIVAVVGIVAWAVRQPAPTFPSSAHGLGLLAVAALVYAVATLVRAWRWHVILRLDGIEHQRRDALGLLVVGYMGNTVLPARGGELLRMFLMSERTGARKRQIAGSIVAERALDAGVLALLFAVLTFAGVGGAPAGRLPAVIAGAAVLCWLGAVAAYLMLRRRGWLAGFADRARPVLSACRPLWGPAGVVLAAVTAGVWVLEAIVFSLVASSLNLSVGILDGLFLDVLASFFALIPAAPGYVGTFDAAMLFGLHALDIRGAAAVSFAILVRFVVFVPITVIGGMLLLSHYGGALQLRRMRTASEPAL